MDKTNSYFLFFVICMVMFCDIKSAGMMKSTKERPGINSNSNITFRSNSTLNATTQKIVEVNTNFLAQSQSESQSESQNFEIHSDNSTRSNYSYAALDKCSNETCNSDVGYCVNEKMCVCKEDFAHFPLNKSETFYPNSACNYEKKKQVIAFLLEFLIPFGSSYFYLGRKDFGLLKLSVLFILPLLVLFFSCHCCKTSSPISNKANNILCNTVALVFLIGLIVWLFWDLINISLGKITDSNGVGLSSYTWHL